MLQPGQKLKIRRLFTLLLFVAVLSAPAAWGSPLQRQSEVQSVRVPSLVGQNLRKAQEILNGSRLGLGQVGRVPSSQPPDTILQQRPEVGTVVRAGSLIDVQVAAAQVLTRMPNLTGMDVAYARTVLAELNLALARVTQATSDRAPGTVIQQQPPAGEIVKPGTEAIVTISAQRPAVPTPGVPPPHAPTSEAPPPTLSERQPPVSQPQRPVSRPQPGVRQEEPPTSQQQPPLSRPLPPFLGTQPPFSRPQPGGPQPQPAGPQENPAGPPPEPLPQTDPPVPPRPVLQVYVPQQPVAPPATQPQLVKPVVQPSFVHPPRGPLPSIPQLVSVPQLIGSDQENARALLRPSGLQLGSVGHTAGLPQGIVVQQEPVAGTLVPPGTVVNIIIASGPSKIPVPGIVGFERPQATRVLDNAGLRLVVTEERASNQTPGTVLQQQPAPGTLVDEGATIVVTVAARLVRVPDLVGRNLDEAKAVLRDADLRLGHIEERFFRLKSGVVEQQPGPGTGVTAGTPVSVMIVNPLGAYVIWFGGGFAALGAGSLTMRRYMKTRMPHLHVRPDPAGSTEAHPVPVVLWPSEIRLKLVFDPGEQSTSLEGL